MRFELQIDLNGTQYALDTYKDEPISLTYNIADVSDISSRNSSFSKTIKLPDTRNNRSVFGDIADLAVSPAYFNPNKKTKAWILVDTAVVFEGYLQLRKVYFNEELDQGDYEVVIYADNDNFYKQLGDFFISDDDYSELDHAWTKTNIIQSWTASSSTGYYYPLIDYGKDWDLGEMTGWTTTWDCQVHVKDLYPSTNVKYIWDKIFSVAGYNYQSNFLNSNIFKNLYIPFNKSSFTRDVDSSAGRFTAGFTQSLTYNNGTVKNTSRTMLTAGPGGAVSTANTHAVSLGSWHVPFNYEGAPYGDPDGVYQWSSVAPNDSTYWYVAPTDFVSEQFVCNFDIRFPYGIDYGANAAGTTDPLAGICFRRSRNPLTGATVSGGYIVPIGGSNDTKKFIASNIPGITYQETGSGYNPSGMGKRVIGQISTDMLNGTTASNTRKLYPGEKLWVQVFYSVPADKLRAQGGMIDATLPSGSSTVPIWQMPVSSGTNYPLITFNSGSQFFNILSPIIGQDETIPYNSVIPKNLKKKDFVSSIVKMFNLYIEPSKDYPNTLIIEPRDDYYQSGTIKDWTRKLNSNVPIEEQILGETQNKKTIFKYKDDKDFYNSDYITTTGGISYGEYDYYIDNDFTTGEKKIELAFSPTPVVAVRVPNSTAYSQLVIPKIVKAQQDQAQPLTDSNVRILTRKYSSTKNTWVYGDYQFNTTSAYNAYIKLTSNGFGNAIHSFNVNDYIRVAQVDGGALKPALQANFKVVEIIDNKTIVIDIPFSYVGSGIAVGGTCYPLDGLVGVAESSTWCFEGSYFRSYPYLGHVNDPQRPTYDINFGQTVGLYYPQTYVTNNNLFNIYWENFINELSDRDSRIMTAEFYLTSYDIAEFKFSDNIFIKDQYFKVNKITNYDPTKEALVKVELIKSQYITIPRTIRTNPWNTGGGIGLANVGLSGTQQLRVLPLNTGGILTTSGNTPLASGTIMAGRDNTGSGLIVGRGNLQSAQSGMVVGNNNTINSDNDGSVILGNTNTANASLSMKPKYIFGNDNVNSGAGLVVGSNNNVGLGTNNAYLFGDNNNVQANVGNVDTATASSGSEASSRIYVFGDGNTIGSSTFSYIQDVFIQGTGSNVSTNNVSLFGTNITAGTNSYGSYIVGDNVTLNTPNTHLVSKPRAVIQGGSLAVSSTSLFSARATFSSTTAVTGTFNTTGAVNMSGSTNITNLTQNLGVVFS